MAEKEHKKSRNHAIIEIHPFNTLFDNIQTLISLLLFATFAASNS